ncbi:MAG: NAD(P)H-dependent oxidoreductase [Firmicutes bacterium]|nr:NAD(P)H-dependent oxidoreductase [Bacillota bacterium]
MPTLQILIASVRPGRAGLPVARWFEAEARRHGHFDLDVVDLAELRLPFMDEPHHPRLRRYVHDHTRAWSARVEAADAFAWVIPEYNYGMSAPLKNAIDYLHQEWAYKPLGFVSYGGVSAGTRAVQQVKEVVTTLKVVPLPEAVHIPFVREFIDEQGEFRPNETLRAAATAMLDELARWEEALRALRTPRPARV